MVALRYLNIQLGKTNFVLAPALYFSNCHQHSDPNPSRPCVSPHTRLGSVGVLYHALGACKHSVERRRRRI